MRSFRGTLVALVVLAACLLPSLRASAGGLYFLDRGTRPLGRGFALVAGADDPSALWYNPAGIAFSGRQLLLDATYVHLDAEYQRIDSGGNELPGVRASTVPLPIPTFAYTDDFGLEKFSFGFGVLAPNALLLRWPESVDGNGTAAPSPQRYSLLSLEGTVLAHVMAAVAYRPTPRLSIALAPQLVVGSFQTRLALSACDGVICAQPENPDYDAVSEVRLFPAVAPALGAGLLYDAGLVRFGLSTQIPFTLGGTAQLRVRVPSAALFDGATVEGDRAHTAIRFPWILRGGIEARPFEELRAEVAVVYERWSRQQEIVVTPENVWLRGLIIDDYEIGRVRIPRRMKDVFSVRVGGSYALAQGKLVLSTGVAWESSSFDDAYLSALTLDSDKVMLGFGVSGRVTDALWLDASYGHFFLTDRNVRSSRVPQQNAIRPALPEERSVYVGNGDYRMAAHMFGVGMRVLFDRK